MAYFSITDLSALIPLAWLTEGLDDAGTGQADAFDALRAMAEAEINGTLAGRYVTPLDTTGNAGLADFLKSLGCLIAAEMVYGRRGTPAEDFIYAMPLKQARARLKAIADGEQPLGPTAAQEREHDSAAVITERSRVHHSGVSY